MVFLSTIGSGDFALMEEVLRDVAEYPKRSKASEAALAAELTRVAMMQVLRAPFNEPNWLSAFDLAVIPSAWRGQAALLALNRMIWHGETERAAVLAEAMLALVADGAPAGSYPDVALKLACARIAHDGMRMDAAHKWATEAARSAKLSGVIFPFLGKALGPKSPIEMALAEEAPDLLAKVKAINAGYFRSLLRLHNRHTGDSVVETLSPREFYLGCALKRGMRYKEIAERMGVSPANAHNLVIALYGTLHIRKASELTTQVW